MFYFCEKSRHKMANFEENLLSIIQKYTENFNCKSFSEESEEIDVLMEAFGITQDLKKKNKQYWGRQLGMCWQLLVTEVFRNYCEDFRPAKKYDDDEPADFFVGKEAFDTKYRVGSGDSGTLKKFKKYGEMLSGEQLKPVILILRTDNLHSAISAFKVGGWEIYTGDSSFNYIKNKTGFDLKEWLITLKDNGKHKIEK
jgi:hypothetical protein